MNDSTSKPSNHTIYQKIPHDLHLAAKHKAIKPVSQLVHAQIHFWMGSSNKGGIAWPGISHLAHELGLSESTVKRSVAELKKLGFLVVYPRPGYSNLYRALDSPDAWSEAWGTRPKSLDERMNSWLKLKAEWAGCEHVAGRP